MRSGSRRARCPRPRRIPLDDAETFKLLQSGGTTAIFQLESRGITDLVRKLQPDRFDDIVALVALFRPGPLQSGMVNDFIACKHGRGAATIDYLHPSLAEILKPTYGVILYQEQVMQIAQTLSGYTLGGADLLRRAMGKKKPEEMATQRSVFVDGAVARGVPAARAGYIFDLIEKFAGYGFNKSHSVAYALLATRRPGSRRTIPRPSWRPCCPATWSTPTRSSPSSTNAPGSGWRSSRPTSTNRALRSPSPGRHDPLRARRHQGRGRGRGGGDRRRARARRLFRDLVDLAVAWTLGSGQAHARGDAESGRFDAFGRTRASLAAAWPRQSSSGNSARAQ